MKELWEKELENFYHRPKCIPDYFIVRGNAARQFTSFSTTRGGKLDPIGDQLHSKGDGIIHRYANRILLVTNNKCPIKCQFCFRQNMLTKFKPLDFTFLQTYLKKHKGIDEIIFSGGDPFLENTSTIDEYLNILKGKVKFVRFHTRTPLILPSRINSKFVNMLSNHKKDFDKIVIALHVNHPDELNDTNGTAIKKLKGFTKLSQTVLLKNVNNDPLVLKKLFLKLDKLEIRPYYLHHPDYVLGGTHFYLPLKKGQQIYKRLSQILPGWLIPKYIKDYPTGKRPLSF